LSKQNRDNSAIKVSKLLVGKRGPKAKKDGWKSSEELDRSHYQNELVDTYDSNRLGDIVAPKPIVNISEVNTKELYDLHRFHSKPCCETRKQLIELGLLQEKSLTVTV
jgi:hypothetical protein